MQKQIPVKMMVLAALFAALTAVCAWISIPVLEIAFTMQTFAIFLTLGLLGGKWGTVSILVYLLVGAAGVPVFSGFRGGIGALVGITGGYLWGFFFAGLVYWMLERFGKLPAMVMGMLMCYSCGSAWFLIYAGGGSLWVVLMKCVIPYLIPDACKILLALYMAKRLAPHLERTLN